MNEVKKYQFKWGDVFCLKTHRPDIVILKGSFIGGDLHAPTQAHMDLLSHMLDQGTDFNSRDELADKQEGMGVDIDFDYDAYRTRFCLSALTDVWEPALKLLVEQLSLSTISEACFKVIKDRLIGAQKERLSSSKDRANVAFLGNMYPAGHPNHEMPIADYIAAIEGLTAKDIRDFYERTRSQGRLTLVLVGDILPGMLDVLSSVFSNWGLSNLAFDPAHALESVLTSSSVLVPIEGKVSADVMMGHRLNINRQDPDYLPLLVGLDALGGNFSARLMRTVRDEQGLTYSIYSALSGMADLAQGYWSIWANYAPEKIHQGIDATLAQCRIWQQGLTKEDLEERKAGICGRYVLKMASCASLASLLLYFIEQGHDENYLFEYPKYIKAITLGQVNQVIQTHVHLDRLLVVQAGRLHAG
ncbi:MAG: insulinase family protein [Gammaproteobacteria bacterium]|nr:insulinase family protein [Gammaproteobacteria bacterium]